MNRTNTVALILGATLILAMFVRNRIRNAVSRLDYGIAPGLKITNFTFGEATLVLPIWVYNPANLNIILSRMNLNIFINKTFAGTVRIDKSYRISAQNKSIIPLTVTLQNTQVMQILIQNQNALLDGSWREKIDITVTGTTRAEAGVIYVDTLPFSLSGNYKWWMG
jgi:hypothetical protein